MCTQHTAPTQLLKFVESLFVVIQNVGHIMSTAPWGPNAWAAI